MKYCASYDCEWQMWLVQDHSSRGKVYVIAMCRNEDDARNIADAMNDKYGGK